MKPTMLQFDFRGQRLLARRSNAVMRWSRNLFLIFGLTALGYFAYVWFDARRYQTEQARRFEQALKDAQAAPSTITGAALGRLEISRVGLSAMVQEGVNEDTLRRAVGHLPHTPLPGERGNVALAGHRDTFFSALRHVRQNDEITFSTLNGAYRYRVTSTRVVEPEATEVLDAGANDSLTLITCYPFTFIGTAPQRFIVSAQQVVW